MRACAACGLEAVDLAEHVGRAHGMTVKQLDDLLNVEPVDASLLVVESCAGCRGTHTHRHRLGGRDDDVSIGQYL